MLWLECRPIPTRARWECEIQDEGSSQSSELILKLLRPETHAPHLLTDSTTRRIAGPFAYYAQP